MSEDVKHKLEATVVHVLAGGHKVVINKGSQDGVKLGQRFLVFELADEIEDPDTGESLGRLEIVRGQGRVCHVQARISTVESTEMSDATKIIRSKKSYSLGALSGMFTPFDREEEVVGGERLPFDDAAVGDCAKPI